MKRLLPTALLFTCLAMPLHTSSLAAAPVVPGFEHLQNSGTTSQLQLGELLLGELNCLACHQPDAESIDRRIFSKKAPDLSQVGSRITPHHLRAYLEGPHSTKPGTTMPDIFHASEAEPKRMAIDFLTHYLVSQGGPMKDPAASTTPSVVDKGRDLFHSIGCVACHAPEPQTATGITTPVIPLGDLARKTTLDALTAFLLDPLKIRQSGRMPSLWLAPSEARAIAVYLLRDQLQNPQTAELTAASPGLRYDYFETGNLNQLPDFSTLEPKQSGEVDRITLDLPSGKRSSNFAVRFTGKIEIPQSGTWRFLTRSDDGSKLYINGRQVVNNDGIHPMSNKAGEIELAAGKHDLEVTYFQGGGEIGLEVLWKGPGIPGSAQPIPPDVLSNESGVPMLPLDWAEFELDAEKAAMGSRMFAALRCVSCHEMGDMRPLRAAKGLEQLDPEAPEGCLGTDIRKGVPNYGLTTAQRNALKHTVANASELRKPLSPKENVERSLAALNCYACHQRDEIGGPDDGRAQFFTTINEIDLGEEGKIPSHLNQVGAKLKPNALRQILVDGELHVRHYMATRMPAFGAANVEPFLNHVGQVDQSEQTTPEPEFSDTSWKIGHQLVGVTGMACVTCHGVNGYKGLGIPGIDLGTVYDRLNYGWFKRFLLDPAGFNDGTRMPQFWPEGKSAFPTLAGGDTDKQIAGIWSYLSLKKSMPLPEGIQLEGTVGAELIPANRPVVHRTFMEDVGPRAILAGFPENLHVAFDANIVRLAKAWRGRFFDASGVASGRTDKFLEPLGEDVIDLPGPALAHLQDKEEPWPQFNPREDRDVGGEFKGYHLDSVHRPLFHYQLGPILVQEQPIPVVRPGGTVLQRSFQLDAGDQNPAGIWFLAGRADSIEKDGKDYILEDRRIRLSGAGAGPAVVRKNQAGQQELIVPVQFDNGKAAFDAVISW